MTELLSAQQLTVAMDYGQFSLSGAADDEDDFADPGDQLMDALNAAMASDGCARVGNVVVMLSPHQNNFDMLVSVERWSVPPPDDLDSWQEAFEVSLEVDDSGLHYESPTRNGHHVRLPPGLYALRVCGRGFVAHGWPGSTDPGDVWRWQVWPTEHDVPAHRLRRWDGRPA